MKSSLSSKKFYVKNLVIEDDYSTISSDKTVVDASLIMKQKEIPDLVVLDKNNQVLGVIADHDIVITTVATGKDPKTTKVVEAMYRIEPVTLDTPVEVAFQRMQQLKVTVVPVVEDGKLKGVVTITDCWGYMPDSEYKDNKGLLTVKDPKFDNYWFTLIFTLLYFFFGFVSPALGIAGFLQSTITNTANNVNSKVEIYLFDAHGGNYYQNYTSFSNYGLIWLILSIYSIIFIIVGLLTTVLIFQWAYSDYKMIKSGQSTPHLSYILGILNIAIMWLLYIIAYSTVTVSPVRGTIYLSNISFDFVGVIFSVAALIFLTIAVFRDFAFKSAQRVPT